MVLVSYSGREINGKIVYYGPGLCGKTTNLEYIYGAIPQTHRGKMVSMKTKTERTLFFDFLPIHLGELSGFKTRFLLYTVPGQVYYNATRKLVLKGVDAIVFVADSKRGKMDENIDSLQNLRENLKEHGLDLDSLPWVIQYNKRDLPDTYTIDELQQALNPTGVPALEAVATTGQGVFDTFKTIARMLLKHLSTEIGVKVVPDEETIAVQSARSVAPAPQPSCAEVRTVHPIATPEMRPAPPPVISSAHTEFERDLGSYRPPSPIPQPTRETPAERPWTAPDPTAAESEPPRVPADETRTPPLSSADLSLLRSRESASPPQAAEAEAAESIDGSRGEGVGDRLRRWFLRGREAGDLTPAIGDSPSPFAEAQEAAAAPASHRPAPALESPAPAASAPPPPVGEPTFPLPFTLAGSTPARQPAQDRAPEPAAPREVPIFVDLDSEDLERGVVLQLRIGLRKSISDVGDETRRDLAA